MSQSGIIQSWAGKTLRNVLETHFKMARPKITALLKANELSGTVQALSGDALIFLLELLDRRKK